MKQMTKEQQADTLDALAKRWWSSIDAMDVEALKAGASALTRAQKACEWTLEEDDIEGQSWLSACGERWCFNDGGPTENKMRYCHGCGGKLTEKGSAQ